MMTREDFLFRIINLYPPYLGAGIRVLHKECDPHTFKVRLGLSFTNRNLFGTQFGGSLYSMCDPFYCFILVKNLGKDYIVWDKAASIEFLKPGKGPVTATFHIPPERIEEIRQEVEAKRKVEPVFVVDVVDGEGVVVARVEKTLYVRKKPGG
ncbi:MAG: DUF4442 domain-containing protein [Thermoanaerobaculia bacterium]|nr:DUF4442 domain-containing protein [Thermoanaerobaculia bacterium]